MTLMYNQQSVPSHMVDYAHATLNFIRPVIVTAGALGAVTLPFAIPGAGGVAAATAAAVAGCTGAAWTVTSARTYRGDDATTLAVAAFFQSPLVRPAVEAAANFLTPDCD